jgi:hypothetical protein
MGRHKKYASEEERLEARRKQMNEANKRYQKTDAYRESRRRCRRLKKEMTNDSE